MHILCSIQVYWLNTMAIFPTFMTYENCVCIYVNCFTTCVLIEIKGHCIWNTHWWHVMQSNEICTRCVSTFVQLTSVSVKFSHITKSIVQSNIAKNITKVLHMFRKYTVKYGSKKMFACIFLSCLCRWSTYVH